jgi:hypothetical protein
LLIPGHELCHTLLNELKAQALALYRTSGDVGMLMGATAVGGAAMLLGNDMAMQGELIPNPNHQPFHNPNPHPCIYL